MDDHIWPNTNHKLIMTFSNKMISLKVVLFIDDGDNIDDDNNNIDDDPNTKLQTVMNEWPVYDVENRPKCYRYLIQVQKAQVQRTNLALGWR